MYVTFISDGYLQSLINQSMICLKLNIKRDTCGTWRKYTTQFLLNVDV